MRQNLLPTLYNHNTSSGLLDFGIPANDIHNEEDIEYIINSIDATAAEDNDFNLPTHIYQNCGTNKS